MDIRLLYENIVVSELTDDLEINGVPLLYDSDSPYMFCNVERISTDARIELAQLDFEQNDVLVIKRYAKEEYLPGYYFISVKDVRGIVPRETYNAMIK